MANLSPTSDASLSVCSRNVSALQRLSSRTRTNSVFRAKTTTKFRSHEKGSLTSLPGRQNQGFTYIGLLILVAIIGIASVATLQTGSILQRRAAEEELLDIGQEFRAALISYINATPAGQRRTPSSLQDLVKDPRYPNTRRHLRKIYADPMTGKEEWGIVEALDGSGIIGVYSLSDEKPIKIGNFDHPLQEFSGKESYREWQFMVADPLAQALSPQPRSRPVIE